MTMLRSQLLFPCAVGIHRRCYAPPPRLSCPLPTLPRSLQAVQVACCSCTHDLGGGGPSVGDAMVARNRTPSRWDAEEEQAIVGCCDTSRQGRVRLDGAPSLPPWRGIWGFEVHNLFDLIGQHRKGGGGKSKTVRTLTVARRAPVASDAG